MKDFILSIIIDCAKGTIYEPMSSLFHVYTKEEMANLSQCTIEEFDDLFDATGYDYVCVYSDNPYYLFTNAADILKIRHWLKNLHLA